MKSIYYFIQSRLIKQVCKIKYVWLQKKFRLNFMLFGEPNFKMICVKHAVSIEKQKKINILMKDTMFN